jgi:hypothetical protein
MGRQGEGARQRHERARKLEEYYEDFELETRTRSGQLEIVLKMRSLRQAELSPF